VKGSISTNNAAARTALIEGGHGLGRIPLYDAWPKIQAGSLTRVLDDYQLNDIDIYGVSSPVSTGSKKLRVLIDFFKDYFDKIGCKAMQTTTPPNKA
jgi:DNA-binding transcriptional LysR family regulator